MCIRLINIRKECKTEPAHFLSTTALWVYGMDVLHSDVLHAEKLVTMRI